EDEVHVGIDSFGDSAVSPPAFQLNHHVRIDSLVEERKRLNHRTTASPWRRRTYRLSGGRANFSDPNVGDFAQRLCLSRCVSFESLDVSEGPSSARAPAS